MFTPIFACLISCGVQISVAIEARAEPIARSETHFTVLSGDRYIGAANPDYIVYSRAVARALTAQGFEESKSGEGDLVVLIDWSVSEPKMVLRHAGGDVGEPAVRGAPAGRPGMPVGGTNNSGSFGFGMEGQDRGELLFTRTLTLKGVDRAAFKADPSARPLWEMKLTSEGDTDEVSRFAPLMMAAAMPYLGVNAGKLRARIASVEDPAKYVRGDIPALPAKK